MGKYVKRKLSSAQLEARVALGVENGAFAWGLLVAQRAAEKAPVDTGRLARSIHSGTPTEIAPMVVQVLIGTNVEYARAHELGSGLYSEDPDERDFIIIEPVNAKALAFEWPGGPKNISNYDPETGLYFFRRVRHPGVRPHPYLRPALRESEEEGKMLLWDAIKVALVR